jgi:hypothetical protein
MPEWEEEITAKQAGARFAEQKRKRKGIISKIVSGALERLGLKNPSEEDENEDINKYSFPKVEMRYKKTNFNNETPNAGIGDVGSWHAEDQMMVELEKSSKAKLRQMVREANRSKW